MNPRLPSGQSAWSELSPQKAATSLRMLSETSSVAALSNQSAGIARV